MKWFRALPPKQAAVLLLIISNLIWGAASPIFKWALTDIPLFTLAFGRFFGAAILLYPLAARRGFYIAKKDWLSIFWMAFFGITLNIAFFFLGLEVAPSINAPIIASSGPIVLILASIIFLKERPKRKTIIGTLVSLVGVIVIIARPLFEAGFDFTAVLGNLFFLIATVAAVIHTILAKEISQKYSAFTVTWWIFIVGAFTFFPFFVRETLVNGGLAELDIRGITGLVFGIGPSSTLAYSLYQWAIEKINASEVGVFTYIDPVIATVIAIPLLGEVITPLFILGSFFVFAGIFVAEGRIHYHPFHKLRTLH